MDVTEFGIVAFLKLVQRKKVEPPMDVTEFGIVTSIKLLQPSKIP